MSKRRSKKLIIAVLCMLIVTMATVVSTAGSSLLTPGTSRINAGTSFDFTLDLSKVIKEAEDSEDATKEFAVALTVSPKITGLSVSEGVGNVNVVSGEYQVSSSQLGKHETLHFTVTPAADMENDTTYTVSVSVRGVVKDSDSFKFVVVAQKKEEPETPTDQKDAKDGQPNMKMPKKGSIGGSMPKGSSGGGSGTASVTYAGSWDNYLDELSVDGYEFTRKFNKIRDTYFMTVPLETTDLTVNTKASDSSAIVAVTGNKDLPEGRSKIMINVTAEDGSVRVYRIYVDRTDEKKEEESKDSDKKGKPEMPEGFELPDGANMPEGFTPPDGANMPEGFTPPDGANMPEGFSPPSGTEKPEGFNPPSGSGKSDKTENGV